MKPDCIIAARRGSQRIKNKNIKILIGKPIIHHVIRLAINSKLFENVYVTTDSQKIAKISRAAGAIVPFIRSKNLSTDKIVLKKAIVDCVKKLKKKKPFYVYIYATAATLKKKDLQFSIKKFIKNKANFLIGIKEFESSPLRGIKINKNGFVDYKWKKFSNTDSKNLEKLYFHPGSFFIFKTSSYLKLKKGFPKKTIYYIHKKYSILDIDEQEDFDQLKIIVKKKYYHNI
jgi:CMP-N-acetylneuraminic acid synthetase